MDKTMDMMDRMDEKTFQLDHIIPRQSIEPDTLSRWSPGPNSFNFAKQSSAAIPYPDVEDPPRREFIRSRAPSPDAVLLPYYPAMRDVPYFGSDMLDETECQGIATLDDNNSVDVEPNAESSALLKALLHFKSVSYRQKTAHFSSSQHDKSPPPSPRLSIPEAPHSSKGDIALFKSQDNKNDTDNEDNNASEASKSDKNEEYEDRESTSDSTLSTMTNADKDNYYQFQFNTTYNSTSNTLTHGHSYFSDDASSSSSSPTITANSPSEYQLSPSSPSLLALRSPLHSQPDDTAHLHHQPDTHDRSDQTRSAQTLTAALLSLLSDLSAALALSVADANDVADTLYQVEQDMRHLSVIYEQLRDRVARLVEDIRQENAILRRSETRTRGEESSLHSAHQNTCSGDVVVAEGSEETDKEVEALIVPTNITLPPSPEPHRQSNTSPILIPSVKSSLFVSSGIRTRTTAAATPIAAASILLPLSPLPATMSKTSPQTQIPHSSLPYSLPVLPPSTPSSESEYSPPEHKRQSPPLMCRGGGSHVDTLDRDGDMYGGCSSRDNMILAEVEHEVRSICASMAVLRKTMLGRVAERMRGIEMGLGLVHEGEGPWGGSW